MESFDLSNVLVWRAVERLLGLVIGGGTIYLGFRLFMALPQRASDSEGKFELPGGISIYISRVGPGVFFALFGAGLVGLSFVNALTFKTEAAATPTQVASAASVETSDFSYVSGKAEGSPINLNREAVVRDARTLRKLEMALEVSVEDDRVALPAHDADALLIALPRVKRMMLRGVWDPQWGSYEAFSQWVRDGMAGPAPKGLDERILKLF